MGGDEEDDEEREEVGDPGAERGHGGGRGIARHGDAAGEGEGAGVAEEGGEVQGVGRRVARAHPGGRGGGPEHQRDACSLSRRGGLGLPCASGAPGRAGAMGSGSRHGRGGCVRCGAAVFLLVHQTGPGLHGTGPRRAD